MNIHLCCLFYIAKLNIIAFIRINVTQQHGQQKYVKYLNETGYMKNSSVPVRRDIFFC